MALKAEIWLEQLKQKFRTIPIDSMFQRVTVENKATIEDKNIQQMDAGLDAEGNKIDPPYSPFTVSIKKALGQPFDRVTLHNEGKFYGGTKAEISAHGFEMTNTDPKWGKITEKYGDVIGINEQSQEEIKEEVYKPGIAFELKNYFEHG